jgi:hypothetical protein
MPQPTGFTIPLSPPRRQMCDFLHFASKVPTVPVERRMNLARLAHARELASPKPGWCALFTKAWGVVCARHAVLRRAYLGWPWPRLYQHPINVASIAVERPYGAEDAVFFLQMTRPEEKPLTEIDARLKWFKDRPLGSAAVVRRQLRLARWPLPVRRAAWWAGMNLSGRHRARFMGTYGVTSYAGGTGSTSLAPRSLLTTTLSYGTVDAAGEVAVRVTYDHRTVDGGPIARALAELERVLQHEVLAELRYLEAVRAA